MIAATIRSWLFPYSHELKELKEMHHRQKILTRQNNEKIAHMMATLNGEDSWFLRLHHGSEKEERDADT
jgi:hypothetical protein